MELACDDAEEEPEAVPLGFGAPIEVSELEDGAVEDRRMGF
ncbi:MULTISPECIES: hypothetical protein [unclassified Cyanobium]|nr:MULTISPECIES: hypothetical protein [unclassified Cyanobium]